MKTETEVLMQEYFINKDKIKNLKLGRRIHSSNNKCVHDKSQVRDECYRDEDCEYDDFCEACKGKHSFYKEIKRLAHRNKGILLRVRGLTKERIEQ